MFPVNPLFNLLPFDIGDAKMRGRNGQQLSSQEREKYPTKKQLYELCEDKNIGIVAMKPFAAGNVLANNKEGHLKDLISLTPVQALSYVLSFRPIACAVPGFANKRELVESLQYLSATEQELDFSEIKESILTKFDNRCMYCNHCQPCPAGLDIARIIKRFEQSKKEFKKRNNYRI